MSHQRTQSFIPTTLEDLFDPSRVPTPMTQLNARYFIRSFNPVIGAPHHLILESLCPEEPLLSLDMKVYINLVRRDSVIIHTEEGPVCQKTPFVTDYTTSGILGWILGVRRGGPGIIQFVVVGVQDDRLVIAYLNTPGNRIDRISCPRFSSKFNGDWYGCFLDDGVMYGRVASIFPDVWADRNILEMFEDEREAKRAAADFAPIFRSRLYDLKWTRTWHRPEVVRPP